MNGKKRSAKFIVSLEIELSHATVINEGGEMCLGGENAM